MGLWMKIIMGLSVLAVLAGSALAENTGLEGREPDGFRGIAWGTPIGEVDGLEFSREGTAALRELYQRTNREAAAQVAVYSRPADRLKIGDATMTRIYYYFYKDMFYGATAYFTGKDNYRKLLEACRKKFGEPGLIEEERMVWEGELASIFLSAKGFLTIDSEEIKRQMEEPEGF
jgi:hypothetical protein